MNLVQEEDVPEKHKKLASPKLEVVGSYGSLVDTLHAVDDEVERLG
jgi:hypothetical protein